MGGLDGDEMVACGGQAADGDRQLFPRFASLHIDQAHVLHPLL